MIIKENDAKLLEFIQKNYRITTDEICKKFGTATQQRLYYDLHPYVGFKSADQPKNSIAYLTDKGEMALQDYRAENKKERKTLWLKNCWIPILVSIVANLAIAGLKKLWPLILKLVS